jgi:hypothetical protein
MKCVQRRTNLPVEGSSTLVIQAGDVVWSSQNESSNVIPVEELKRNTRKHKNIESPTQKFKRNETGKNSIGHDGTRF